MSCLWMHLSLLYLLQHSVSSDQVVSLTCPSEVEVAKGANVTINCTIEWNNSGTCNGIVCRCFYPDSNIGCGNALGKYICNWNSNSHVLLTIVNASKDENVTVDIEADCGMERSRPIRVHVLERQTRGPGDDEPTHLTSSILGVFATIIVVAILLFLIKRCIAMSKNLHNRNSYGLESPSVK